MEDEGEKIEGWGVFDRLKNLPHLMTVKGDVVKAPCKLSLQSEIDEEASDAQEFFSPPEHQGDEADPIILENDSNEGGEAPEDNESALSSRELLNQLQAVAVGVRDFEPKTERVRPKRSTSQNSSKKETTPKKSSSSKATSKAILKAASRVRHGVIVKESKERENLTFSDAYLEKTFGLSKTARIEKPKSPAKERLKAKIKERIPLSTEGLVVKKEVGARQRESSGWESEDKLLPSRKKAKVAVKGAVKFRLRVLPHEKLVLPEAALAEVMSAKEERDIAKTEMAKLLDEIRATKNDNFDDLPSDVTERWMAAHAKKLRNSFSFHTTVTRHTLASVAPKVGP